MDWPDRHRFHLMVNSAIGEDAAVETILNSLELYKKQLSHVAASCHRLSGLPRLNARFHWLPACSSDIAAPAVATLRLNERIQMSCAICEKRPPKRYCPAKGEKICAICCGREREVTIDCPSDCPHSDRRAPLRGGASQATDGRRYPYRDIVVREDFVYERWPADHRRCIRDPEFPDSAQGSDRQRHFVGDRRPGGDASHARGTGSTTRRPPTRRSLAPSTPRSASSCRNSGKMKRTRGRTPRAEGF